jgi:hypothetical protein
MNLLWHNSYKEDNTDIWADELSRVEENYDYYDSMIVWSLETSGM